MDTEGLLKSLNAHDVVYVVIGAAAFPVHGYSRATLDIDVFIQPTPDNAARTLRALTAFGYDVTDNQKAVIAFQRRFRPDLIDGIIDGECRAKLLALLLPRPQ